MCQVVAIVLRLSLSTYFLSPRLLYLFSFVFFHSIQNVCVTQILLSHCLCFQTNFKNDFEFLLKITLYNSYRETMRISGEASYLFITSWHNRSPILHCFSNVLKCIYWFFTSMFPGNESCNLRLVFFTSEFILISGYKKCSLTRKL
jgi:hypothetical protein